jgi:hypothetical protein
MLLEPQPIAGALGGALLTGAITRQVFGRRAAARRLRAALRDGDPAVRAAAAEAAGESGVTKNAALLLATADLEQDVWVRQVIAQTVQRHLWEPPTSRSMIELRIWAKRELDWARFEPIEAHEPERNPRISAAAVPAPALEPDPEPDYNPDLEETITSTVSHGWKVRYR